MHYPRDAFSVDGSDTITPTDPAAQIGQRNGLSPGDIAAAESICARRPTLKEFREPTLKEFREPTLKEFQEPTLKEFGEPPFVPRPGLPGTTGGLPFAVATPHQAGGRAQGPDFQTYIGELEAHLGALAVALVHAQTDQAALQQDYEQTAALLQEALTGSGGAGPGG